MKKRADFLISY